MREKTMPNRPRVLRSQREIIGHFEVVNPSAAGVDAGSEGHLVSVPEDRAAEPVRTFGTFTKDLLMTPYRAFLKSTTYESG
jgi:hypothetical protein